MQTVQNNTYTKIESAGRIPLDRMGYYEIYANADCDEEIRVSIFKNGGSIADGPLSALANIWSFGMDDYVEMFVYQCTGKAVEIKSANLCVVNLTKGKVK
jgi:hypothetical protein